MKRLVTFFILGMWLTSLICVAQNTLSIHQKDGSVVYYAFSEKPVVSYLGDCLQISTEKECIVYPLDQLEKMTFIDTGSSIGVLSIDCNESNVSIVRLDGTLVKYIPSTCSSFSFDASDLCAGTYIVKHGLSTSKIIIK